MPNAISYEYLKSIKGTRNGLATLNSNGIVPRSQLPPDSRNPFRGTFATSNDLPQKSLFAGSYAYVTGTQSFWYYNWLLDSPQWVNQNITATAYLALSEVDRSVIPYIII